MKLMTTVLTFAVVLAACTDPTTPEEALAPDASSAGGPSGQWTWFDVPGAVCGDGSQTGFAVNPGTGSELLIYLEGGGLCWDELSCNVGVNGIQLASFFLTGYDGQRFQHQFGPSGPASGVFDRAAATNAFKDATLVYVPYCTGDLHTGSTTGYFPITRRTGHWMGGRNLELFLSLMVQSYPAPSRVTLSGSSAGGYGALLNYDRVKQAYSTTRVDLVSDSGPLWNNPLFTNGYNVWNTRGILPADCAQCLIGAPYPRLYSYLSTKYPTERFAFLSHDEDLVIAAGNLMLPYPVFYFSIKNFTLAELGPLPNWRYFVAGGTAHTFLYDVTPPLAAWLTQMQVADPSWRSVTSINQ